MCNINSTDIRCTALRILLFLLSKESYIIALFYLVQTQSLTQNSMCKRMLCIHIMKLFSTIYTSKVELRLVNSLSKVK